MSKDSGEMAEIKLELSPETITFLFEMAGKSLEQLREKQSDLESRIMKLEDKHREHANG